MDFWCAISDFLASPSLPELMQGAAVAVLTLLVSFAIGIFVHHLGDGERKGNFLDLHVALDYVWLFKYSLIALAAAVLSPLLLDTESPSIRIFAFFVWLISLVFLFWLVLRLYEWVKGDKDGFRLKYLSTFPKSPRDNLNSWRDHWSSKEDTGNRFNEKDFFVAFSAQIDSILNSEKRGDWELLPNLLEGFLSNIQNRNKTFILVFPEFFPKVLEWHFILWKRQFSRFAMDKEDSGETQVDIRAFEADSIVDQIIKYVTKEALTGKSPHSFSYFKYLEEHIDKYEAEQIVGSKHVYVYIRYIPVYYDILNGLPKSNEAFDIWRRHFPPKWKITISNLKTHTASRAWLHFFLEWSRSRIWQGKKEWDEDLDEVSRELFPNVDPIIWARILTFVMRPWSGSRVKTVIESNQNFGYIGRIFTGWGDSVDTNFSKLHQEQLMETIRLAVLMFGGIFTLENLNEWLSDLEQLEYDPESDYGRNKEQWKEIFTALSSHLKEGEVFASED